MRQVDRPASFRFFFFTSTSLSDEPTAIADIVDGLFVGHITIDHRLQIRAGIVQKKMYRVWLNSFTMFHNEIIQSFLTTVDHVESLGQSN